MYTCDLCEKHSCTKGEVELLPINCPCRELEKLEKIKSLYKDEELKIAYNSALVESEGYCQLTRVQEIIDFAKRMNYKKIGLAFCLGLSKEAKTFGKILRYHGFQVNSVICKNGGVSKKFIGIEREKQVRPYCEFEAMCNPIGQAEFLNSQNTDFNILLGLCVGHDTLFIKHSDAPITVFAVKDRVLGHNPLAVIYTAEGYYNKKLFNK